MVSEIKGAGSHAPQVIGTGQHRAAPQTPADATGSTSKAAVVSVTDFAARLQKLTDSVDKLPVVDQARVTELRDALAAGEYQVDDQKIADKLTSLETLLGRLGRD
jgi:negative regulator of flagellin synthesis FlgM